MSTRSRTDAYYTKWKEPEKDIGFYTYKNIQISASDPRRDLCHVGYTFFLSDEVKALIRNYLLEYVSEHRDQAWSGDNHNTNKIVSDDEVTKMVDYMMSHFNERIFVAVIHINQKQGNNFNTKIKLLKNWFEKEQTLDRRVTLTNIDIELLGGKGTVFNIGMRIAVDLKAYYVTLANSSNRKLYNVRTHIASIANKLFPTDKVEINYDVSQGS